VLPWSTGFHRLKLFLCCFDFGGTHVCEQSDTNADQLAFLYFETFFQTGFFHFSQNSVFRLWNGKAVTNELGFSQLVCFRSSDFFRGFGGRFLAAGFVLVAAERFAAGLVFEFILEVSLKLTVVYFTTVPKKRYKSFIRYDGIHQK
jgi:hypothetical protein